LTGVDPGYPFACSSALNLAAWGRANVRKLRGRDKDGLINEEKRKENKQGMQCKGKHS